MTTQTSTLTPVDKITINEKTGATRILPNYVNGGWVLAQASGLIDVTNPASGEVLARVPWSGTADVETAVAD